METEYEKIIRFADSKKEFLTTKVVPVMEQIQSADPTLLSVFDWLDLDVFSDFGRYFPHPKLVSNYTLSSIKTRYVSFLKAVIIAKRKVTTV